MNQLEENDVKMKKKVTELEAKVQEQDLLITSLLQEKNERMKTHSDFTPISISQSAVAINGLPTSCEDLLLIGHTLNGFYSVMGSAMMESVYCDFTKLPTDAGFEKWIGYADVKSAPVHFYVQRNSNFNTTGIPIPFQLARVNYGNALDLTTGIFTAPRNGIYFFSFTGLAEFPESTSKVWLEVDLYLNGVRIGSGFVEDANTVDGQSSPLTLQSTLNLKTGDQVWLSMVISNVMAFLYDDITHHTHFTGFTLQEEIASSLL